MIMAKLQLITECIRLAVVAIVLIQLLVSLYKTNRR